MKALPLLIFFLIAIPLSLGIEQLYLLELSKSGSTLILDDLNLAVGAARTPSASSGYHADVVSFSGEVLYSVIFQFEDSSLLLVITYFTNGELIKIYDSNNNLVLTVDVSQYAQCNENGICDPGEDAGNCAVDCYVEEESNETQPPSEFQQAGAQGGSEGGMGGATKSKKDNAGEAIEEESSSPPQITGAAVQEQQTPTDKTTSQPSPKRKIWPYILIGIATLLVIILIIIFIIRKTTYHFDEANQPPYNFDDFNQP